MTKYKAKVYERVFHLLQRRELSLTQLQKMGCAERHAKLLPRIELMRILMQRIMARRQLDCLQGVEVKSLISYYEQLRGRGEDILGEPTMAAATTELQSFKDELWVELASHSLLLRELSDKLDILLQNRGTQPRSRKRRRRHVAGDDSDDTTLQIRE